MTRLDRSVSVTIDDTDGSLIHLLLYDRT